MPSRRPQMQQDCSNVAAALVWQHVRAGTAHLGCRSNACPSVQGRWRVVMPRSIVASIGVHKNSASPSYAVRNASKLLFGIRTTGSPFLPRRPIEIRGLSIVRGGSSRRNNTFYIVQSQTHSAPRHGQPPSGSLGALSCPLQSRDGAEGPRTANPGRWRAAEAPAVPAPTSAVLDGQVISAASGGQGAGSSQNRCRSGPRLRPSRNLGSRHSAFRQAFRSAGAAPGPLAAAIGMPIPCSRLCSAFCSVQQRCCVIVRARPPLLILLMPTPPPLSISTTDRQCLTLRAEA